MLIVTGVEPYKRDMRYVPIVRFNPQARAYGCKRPKNRPLPAQRR